MNNDLITFLVTRIDGYDNRTSHCITRGPHREAAKSFAALTIGGNPDNYIVIPLTKPGEDVWLVGIFK